jgi:hypothetical protein
MALATSIVLVGLGAALRMALPCPRGIRNS